MTALAIDGEVAHRTLMISDMILSIQLYTRRQKPYLLNCLISMILCYHPFLISTPLCRLRLLFNVLRLPGSEEIATEKTQRRKLERRWRHSVS